MSITLKNPDKRRPPFMERLPRWLKKNLFATPTQSVVSIFLIAFIGKVFEWLFDWLFVNSVWVGNSEACKASSGACVAFIIEKFNFILFGVYPASELWRAKVFVLIAIGLFIHTGIHRLKSKRTLYSWLIGYPIALVFLMGGVFGLKAVPSAEWGGLPLTLFLAFNGLFFAYPIGILLAIGRRSELVLLKTVCVGFIELIRGVPLISLLFMSSVMFPLFLPEGVVIDKLLRAQVALIMFVSAYMAEVVRGGLQAIPKGQYEAAEALGLNKAQTLFFIILPQALKIVIPPTVNTSIGLFKDTSLVIIIALFDLMYSAKASLKDPNWLGFSLEAYIFVGVIYYLFCAYMSWFAKKLESDLSRGASSN
jgi:general L-amino acid transport system permease protein